MSVEDSWFAVDKATGKKVQTKRHGRGKRWRVRNHGAPTKSYEKKSDAEDYDVEVRADLYRGVVPFDHKAGRILFEDYVRQQFLPHHPYTGRSRSTVESRINTHLMPAFGKRRMCDIAAQPRLAKNWLAELRTAPSKRTKRPLSPSTVAVIYAALSVILSAAKEDKVIAVNPLDDVPFPYPPKGRREKLRVWEQGTVAALLDAVPDRQHAIPGVASWCGHRQMEVFAVAKQDVNFLRRKITVRHQVARVDGQLVLVPPKGQKIRTVPLPGVAAAALSTHIEQYGTVPMRCECCRGVSDVLFTDRGKLLSPQDWNEDVWHPALRAATLTPAGSETGLHQLRHFYASMLIDGGATPKQIQEYMGHASIKITYDIYGHLFDTADDKARDIVDTAFSGNDSRPSPMSGVAGAYPARTQQDQ